MNIIEDAFEGFVTVERLQQLSIYHDWLIENGYTEHEPSLDALIAKHQEVEISDIQDSLLLIFDQYFDHLLAAVGLLVSTTDLKLKFKLISLMVDLETVVGAVDQIEESNGSDLDLLVGWMELYEPSLDAAPLHDAIVMVERGPLRKIKDALLDIEAEQYDYDSTPLEIKDRFMTYITHIVNTQTYEYYGSSGTFYPKFPWIGESAVLPEYLFDVVDRPKVFALEYLAMFVMTKCDSKEYDKLAMELVTQKFPDYNYAEFIRETERLKLIGLREDHVYAN